METLLPELLTQIFTYARSLRELFTFAAINKRSFDIVRAGNWPDLNIYINPKNIEKASQYSFSNISLNCDIANYPSIANCAQYLNYYSRDKPINDKLLFPNVIDIGTSNLPNNFNFSISMPKCQNFHFGGIKFDMESLKTIRKCRVISFQNSKIAIENMIEFLKLHPECEEFSVCLYNDGDVHELYQHLSKMKVISINAIHLDKIPPIPVFPECRSLTINAKSISIDILVKMVNSNLESISFIDFVAKIPDEWFPYLGKLNQVDLGTCSYNYDKLIHLKNCSRISVWYIPSNIIKELTNIRNLTICGGRQRDTPIDLHLIPSTINYLLVDRTGDFDCDLVKNWPHLIGLDIFGMNIVGDLSLLKNLRFVSYASYGNKKLDFLKEYGVNVYDSCPRARIY